MKIEGKPLMVNSFQFTEQEKRSIKSKWEENLGNGYITYDPEEGSLSKNLGIYTINFLPGRLQYLRDNPPRGKVVVDTPHSKQDVFCSQWDEIEKEQKITDFKIKNYTWRILSNNSPIERYHCVLIPDGNPHNQTMSLSYFEDLAILAKSDNGISLGFNSLGAAASQNHFHFHLFFNHWSRETIATMPIMRNFFKIDDISSVTKFTKELVSQNIGHNITMSSEGIIITQRLAEQINGIRYGVDAISGRFLTTSLEQYEATNIDSINSILNQIAFPKKRN